ncbi:MAG: hypothetical protein B7Y02_03130 [Rhodobacterales bacterium 17-64-5]|nr:MAG: hypothetical protein B7Y02_03130 [Rhodobacterales bacterium 17-64-5]
MKTLRTLYLLASEEDFRLLRTDEPQLKVLAHRKADDFADVAYRYPSEQSHNHGGPGAPGFDTGATANKTEQERIRFARHIVETLQDEWSTGNHDRIVIAAGPKLLGQLRDEMPAGLHAHVAAELHKDLMKIPLHDLSAHFADVSVSATGP